MAGYEIHEAKIDALDTGQPGDLPDLAQRAVALDQHMHPDPAVDTETLLDFAQRLDLHLYVTGGGSLR